MPQQPFPAREDTTILFAHAAYQMSQRFSARNLGVRHIEVRSFADLEARVPEADVVVVSGLWRNTLLDTAPKLRFVQSISAGTDQYDRAAFRQKGVRLASGAGVNAAAVAEHAVALLLAFTRRLHLLRDAQTAKTWRPMLSDLSLREEELGGKTLLVMGLGRIGNRVAALGRAFGMRVIATRVHAAAGAGAADAVYPHGAVVDLLPEADVVVLTCPLTPQTERLIDAAALARMKPTAYLINVARGRVVDEPALIAALQERRIAGAGLDCTWDEPLPASSPLWTLPNAIVTPHSAGETQAYEDNVLDILMENLERLWRGETTLRNEVV